MFVSNMDEFRIKNSLVKKHLKNRFHSLKENKSILLTYGVIFTYLTLLKKYIWHISVIYT